MAAAAARATRRPHTTLFHGQVQTGCGPATSDVGPFYCPVDKTAYFDTDFFQVLVDQFGSSGGPLAQEYVVAHEFGHHVQDLQGTLGRAQQGAQGATGNGVRTELQADCYAGCLGALRGDHQAGGHRRAVPGAVERQGHCRRAVGGLVGRRRPHPEGRPPAGSTRSSGPTARPQQRQKWFTVGYQTGDPNKCDTFATDDLG